MNTTPLVCKHCGRDYEQPTVYLEWAKKQDNPTVKWIGEYCYLCRHDKKCKAKKTLPVEQINQLAKSAGQACTFKSNYPYDRKSYEDGFKDGMLEAMTIDRLKAECKHEKSTEVRWALKCDDCGKIVEKIEKPPQK